MPTAPPTAQLLSHAARLFAAGDPQRAAALCREALRQSPDDPRTLHLHAACLLAVGDVESAERALARAVRAAPRDPDLLVGHGSALLRLGRPSDAIASIDRALAIRPDDDNALASKAEALFRAGDIAPAFDLLLPRLNAGATHIGVALSLALLCPRKGRHEDVAAMLRRCIDSGALPPVQRMRALFALGDVLDGLARYDDAFNAYSAANAMKAPRPDLDAYHASLAAMLAAWTPEALESLPRASLETQAPVFIVGMPRSGTSLAEQILASHPDAFGAGERKDLNRLVAEIQFGRSNPDYHLHHTDALTRKVVDRSARKVLDALRALAPRAARIADKNPVNYLHLGLISILFPRAKVVHCVRDPIDTALSCYFNNIVGAHAFADSLPALARWTRDYQRVMRHWNAVLNLDILELRLEDLVADPETHARRLIAHVELPWDDACLRFHENKRLVFTPSADQVRRPIFSAGVGRWKNYDRHLAPLREALAEPVPPTRL